MSNSNKNSKFAELMESNRQRKVAQIIQEDFAELFRKQSQKANRVFLVSVSDVKISPDLGVAKIYLSIFPQEFRGDNYERNRGKQSTIQKFSWSEDGKAGSGDSSS